MEQEATERIQRTRRCFEESFEQDAFYNRQTRDDNHLALILSRLPIKDSMKILDLGTGTGFLAFPLAGENPTVEVTGLDIVQKALCVNRQRAKELGLENLHIVSYDGTAFPFADGEFDLIVSRYALHHFPNINETFQEISRVLKPGGLFFLSDPTPNGNDTKRFADAYMRMKKDGHIRFYTKEEWRELGGAVGFFLTDEFETSIRFPRKRESTAALEELLRQFGSDVVQGYGLELVKDEIWITERVNNLLFQKRSAL